MTPANAAPFAAWPVYGCLTQLMYAFIAPGALSQRSAFPVLLFGARLDGIISRRISPRRREPTVANDCPCAARPARRFADKEEDAASGSGPLASHFSVRRTPLTSVRGT